MEINNTVINFYVQLFTFFFAVWGQGAKKLLEDEKVKRHKQKVKRHKKTTDPETTAALEVSISQPSTSREGTVKVDEKSRNILTKFQKLHFSDELPMSEVFHVQEACMQLLGIR